MLGGGPVTGHGLLLFPAWLSGSGTGLPPATSGHHCAHRSLCEDTTSLVLCAMGKPAPAQPVWGLLASPHPHHCLLCTPPPAWHKKKTTAKGKGTPHIKIQEKVLTQIVGLSCWAVLVTSAHLLRAMADPLLPCQLSASSHAT